MVRAMFEILEDRVGSGAMVAEFGRLFCSKCWISFALEGGCVDSAHVEKGEEVRYV